MVERPTAEENVPAHTRASAATPDTILFLDHTATLGGGEIALLNLVQRLDTRRFQPVVVLSSEGKLQPKLVEAGIETHVLPLSTDVMQTRKDSLGTQSLLRLGVLWHSLRYVVRLAKFMRRRQVALVHTNSLKADILGGCAARLARVPVIWHVRDRIESDYLPAPVVTLFRWLCRWVPTYVIANSEATLRTLRLKNAANSAAIYSGILHHRSRVVHDGVGETGGRLSCRQDEDRPPTIGLVGRISPWKGQHVFIEAAAAVRARFPNARFQIIGSALFGEVAYEAQIRTQAAALGLDDCLEFTGFRADVPQLIQQLTLLVHASTTGEPFGQVVVEGMAAGKPVIATNGGGVPEIVEDGVTGLLIPMNDAPALTAAVLRLLSDPETARAMGSAGYQRVQERFTIEHTVYKVESVYEELLHRGDASKRNTSALNA